MSGNYALTRAGVDCSAGYMNVDPKDLKKADVPKALMELARHLAIDELKNECPILKTSTQVEGEEQCLSL